MKRAHLFTLCMMLVGCGLEPFDPPSDGPVAAVQQCTDKTKIDRCSKDGPGTTAMCYGPGEIGPQPWLSGGDHPYFDCAAPDENNIVGPAPFYYRNYWCCGARGCTPGAEVPCTCSSGSPGVAYCSGDGLNVGACVCAPTDAGVD